MSFVISYISLTYCNYCSPKSRFGGSSSFRVVGDELLISKRRKSIVPKLQIDNTVLSDSNFERQIKPFDDSWDSNISRNQNFDQVENSLQEDSTDEKKRSYKLNKTKVKRKCHAFSRLAKSKKFMAFYTLSFPMGLNDDICYKVFNTWLTRCRKNVGLKSYLWVAERQKNGTIHFHILTNDFMDISIVNGYMASALTTEKLKGNDALIAVDIEKYNGIDVKRVKGSSKSLIGYIAKYVSKNEIEFYRQPWHCSRDISRLFISEYLEEETEDKVFDHLPKEENKYKIFRSDFYSTASFKFIPDDKIYSDLDGVNEIVYKSNI